MDLLMQGMMCFVGETAFAVLLGTPRKYCLHCGAVGTIGYLCYFLLIHQFGVNMAFAVAVGTFLILFCSRVLAVWMKVPATLFVVVGIFPLVPGTGIYYTAYYMISNDGAAAAMKGAETLKVALALAIGILIGNAIPQRWYNQLEKLHCCCRRWRGKG